MSQDALLEHIVSRMQGDIDFLVQQNVISPADGEVMSAKLPGRQSPMMPTPVASPSPVGPAAPMGMARRGVPQPPVPQATQGRQARALWAYNESGQEAGDLSFSANETVEILEETNADWWKGKNARGETGLFPSNYVEKIAGGPPVWSPPVGGRMVAPPFGGKSSYDPMAAPQPEPPTQEQQQGQPPKKNKFGKYGGTMAQSAAGGVGFGAGAAIGGGLVRAIF